MHCKVESFSDCNEYCLHRNDNIEILNELKSILKSINFYYFCLKLFRKMARFKENDLPKAKLSASSLNKAILIFKYAENHK